MQEGQIPATRLLTETGPTHTILSVSTKWAIPTGMLGFVVFIALMWAYSTSDDDTSSPAESRIEDRDLVLDPEIKAIIAREDKSRGMFAGARNPARPAKITARSRGLTAGSLVRSLNRRIEVAAGGLAQLADMIDSAAIHWRSKLGRYPTWQAAAAYHSYCEGRPFLALRQYDRLLRRHPDNAMGLSGKAIVLVAVGQFSEAGRAYERLVALVPGNADVNYNYGVLLSRLGKFGRASDQFRAAVNLAPDHFRAWHNLASHSQRDGSLAEARMAWRAYTLLEPESATGWFNLGVVCMDFGLPDEAARCFSNVVIIAPEDPDGFVNLALAYKAVGDFAGALSILDQTNELAPCDRNILRARADLHLSIASTHPYDEAVHRVEAARLEEEIQLLDEEAAPDTERVADGSAADGME